LALLSPATPPLPLFGPRLHRRRAGVNGGGLYLDYVPQLGETYLTANTAGESGGGLFVLGSSDFQGCATDFYDAVSVVTWAPTPSPYSSYASSSAGSSSASSPCLRWEGVVFDFNAAGCCYTASPEASSNSTCQDFDGQSSGLEKCCAAGTWDDGLACQTCPDGFDCSTPGLLSSTVAMNKGYWRTDFSDFTVMLARKCWHPAACKGNVTAKQSSDEYCAPGYRGPCKGTLACDPAAVNHLTHPVPPCNPADCAVCANDFSSGITYECNLCAPGSRAGAGLAVCVAVLFVLGAAWYVVSDVLGVGDATDASSEAQGGVKSLCSLLRHFPFGTLRIPVVVFQLLTQYTSITGLRFPPLYQNFLSWVNAINLDMGWVLSIGCLANFDFYDRLLFATITPLVIFALLGCSLGFASRRLRHPRTSVGPLRSSADLKGSREELRQIVIRKHVSVALAVSFLIYSTVSTAVFQTFACDTFSDAEGGNSYLRADYSISCDDDKHLFYVIYAAFMVVLYPIGKDLSKTRATPRTSSCRADLIEKKNAYTYRKTAVEHCKTGIPAVYAWSLWHRRAHFAGDKFRSSKELLPKGHTLRTIGFLWKPYKRSHFWWEIVECVRRLCLTGFLVFIMPGTSGQVRDGNTSLGLARSAT